MKVPVIAFFNNKGGVGKTTLVYHLAWAMADQGRRILVVDLDPQADLTATFLDDNRMAELWETEPDNKTFYGCIAPLMRGAGDIESPPYTAVIDYHLHLLPGSLSLSLLEDELSESWTKCLDGDERAFRILSASWRAMQAAAVDRKSDLILVDLGPNLGSINRSALIASDFLVTPLTPDFASLQGLKNMGPTIKKWRKEWSERSKRNKGKKTQIPNGEMIPLGYVFMQHSVRTDWRIGTYERWAAKIPEIYAQEISSIGKDNYKHYDLKSGSDPNCIGLVKHYRSLIPISMEANKPMFHLLPADGALGSHAKAAQEAGKNFKDLALEIEKRYTSHFQPA